MVLLGADVEEGTTTLFALGLKRHSLLKLLNLPPRVGDFKNKNESEVCSSRKLEPFSRSDMT